MIGDYIRSFLECDSAALQELSDLEPWDISREAKRGSECGTWAGRV